MCMGIILHIEIIELSIVQVKFVDYKKGRLFFT